MILSIADHFSIIKDPRQQRKIEYELLDIIFLCVVGMICGAEAWDDIEAVGEARLDWFQNKGFLLNGVPNAYPQSTGSRQCVFNKTTSSKAV